ncbi:MAG: hypothetical protein ACQETV_02380 [Actinomycetota bacterium]
MRTPRKLLAILGAGLLSLGLTGCDLQEGGFLDGIVERIADEQTDDTSSQ